MRGGPLRIGPGAALLTCAVLLAGGGGAAAQEVGGAEPSPAHPGEALRVYVLTAAPGDAIWERFGHNAIRIVDEARGTDVSWNWGLFSFQEEDFMTRLIRGTMRYWMGGVPTTATLGEYRAAGRAVWVQELDLPPEARWRLREAILVNSLPENRFYRYDYYRDNCSTRVRDMVDLALDGALRARFDAIPTGTTYRSHTRRLLQEVPWAYTGIQIALGHRADRPITAWEEMFLPMRLREHLAEVTVDRDGRTVPLVRSEERIVAGDGTVPADVPSRLASYLALGVVLAAAVVGAGAWAAGGSWAGRALFVVLAGGWSMAGGALGALLVGAWLFTDHVFWRWNENVLQTDPLALGVGLGLLALLVTARLPRPVAGLAVVVGALSLLGAALQIFPGLDQVNGEIVALWTPVNLAVAWGAVRLARSAPAPVAPRAAAAAGRARAA